MSKNVLDIDESIIRKNLLLTETQKDDENLNNLLKTLETPSAVPSITFRPLPGVCIKTKTDKGEKVFINLCHTTEIPAPKDITDEEFLQLLDEEQPNWCIPMSVGHERFELSKDGTSCATYDIAVNTNFFNKIKKEKHFFSFTILTMISAIEEKHDKTLDSKNYVVLKNRKVTGTLHDHRIQKREVKQPSLPRTKLIEEIPDVNNTMKNQTTPTVDESQYVLIEKSNNGSVESLMGFFKLPNCATSKDISVNINEDRLVVDAVDFNYIVDIFLPQFVNPNEVVASMDPNLQVLRVDMPM